jgi:drug/metabolite transporter (DMT)-like permease
MLCGCVAFTFMTAFAHALRNSCDWQVVALARSGLALVFAVALARSAGAQLFLWHSRTLWVRSLAGSCSLLCTFFALSRLPVSDVLTLTNTFPIWVALLSWPLLGEPPPLKVWLAVAVGVAGVVLVQQPHFARGEWAVLFALAASFGSAVAMLGLHRLQGIDARAIVAHFSGVSALSCAAAYFVFPHSPSGPSLTGAWVLPGLLGVGVSATIGQLFLTRAFAAGPPAKVSLVALSQIVFGLLVDAAVFGHELNLVSLAGIALVVGTTAWVLCGRDDAVSEGEGESEGRARPAAGGRAVPARRRTGAKEKIASLDTTH